MHDRATVSARAGIALCLLAALVPSSARGETPRARDPRVAIVLPEAPGLVLRQARPVALAKADVDRDGIPDLVCGYSLPGGGGMLVVYPGNPDAIYPNEPAARARRAAGRSSAAPFLAPSAPLDVPGSPDHLLMGDFDNDGRQDVIAAQQGGVALWFLAGTSDGALSAARSVPLPGKAVSLATGEIDRADGLADLAIGVVGPRGAALPILRGPRGALRAEPVDLALPASPTAIIIAALDDDHPGDLAVAAGDELLVFSGVDSQRPDEGSRPEPTRRRFEAPLAALAAGDFTGDEFPDLAVLSEGGRLHVLELRQDRSGKASASPASGGTQARTISGREVGYDDALAAFPAQAEQWSAPQARALSPAWSKVGASCPIGAGAARLAAARMTGGRGQDLLVGTDLAATPDSRGGTWLFPAGELAGAASVRPVYLEEAPASVVLPMRLNADAIDDLVVLGPGAFAPSAVISAAAATFNVTSSGDGGDCDTNDTVCATGSGGCPSGPCTLRAAMMQANASPGADVITFAIGSGPVTINPASFLPILTGPVTIDGTSQPGYAGSPIIEIDGTGAGNPANGLTVDGGSSTIRGLVVNKFSFRGIEVRSAGNVVEGNYSGINVAGTTSKPNALDGILVNNAPNNTIGGTTAAARNVSSGNSGDGIQIFGPAATGNMIRGNRVGTNPAGNAGLGNGVGSPCSGGAPGHGVSLNSASTNTIGGTAAAARNLISGNLCDGVVVSGPSAGGNLIQGNYIGTNAAGTAAVPNAANAGGGGIRVVAPSTTVGGTAAGARNVISGNFEDGVEIPRPDMSGNVVLGNYIGTDATGNAELGNEIAGILLPQTPGVQVGGTTAAARNVVSANVFGIVIFAGASNVHVEGNYIGVASDGTTFLGNFGDGIFINQATSNFIGGSIGVTTGGACTGSCNVISGNGDNGVKILGPSTTQNVVAGNRIGTDRTGAAAMPNGIGVLIDGAAADNVIGGLSTAAGNVISGNATYGVAVVNAGATGNRVQANTIGRTASGASPLPNGASGVFIQNTTDTTVGIRPADGVEAGNLIGSNGQDGVRVVGAASVRNRIRANRIHSNTGLGIDLAGDGVTLNDPLDPDAGPNTLMNFPEQISVNYDSASNQTHVGGRVTSPSPTSITVDLYANQFEDPLRHGEGEVYLGSVTPNSDGSFCFTLAGQIPLPVGPPAPKVTATATDAAGSTSEFSSTRFDVELLGLEVVQVVQDFTNSVKLFKGKETWVRANLQQSDPATGPRVVEGQLRAFNLGGTELAGSPIFPTNFGVFRAGLNALDRRVNFHDTLNFRLPDAWLDGSIQLRFERTNGDVMCREPRDVFGPPTPCADCSVQATFLATNTLQVKFLDIKYTDQGNIPRSLSSSDIAEAARVLVATYPIASVDWTEGQLLWTGPIGPSAAVTNPGPWIDEVVRKTKKQWLLDGLPTRIYYGLITNPNNFEGLADDIPAKSAAGFFPKTYFGFGRHTHTHELGHTLGRHHSVDGAIFGTYPSSVPPPATYANGACSDATDHPPPTGAYPHFYAVPNPSPLSAFSSNPMPTFGPMPANVPKDKLFFGLDTALSVPRGVDPYLYYDLMSYCARIPLDMWNSKFTLEGLQTAINSIFPASVATPKGLAGGQEYLVFEGWIDRQNDLAVFDRFFRWSDATGVPPTLPGNYVLRLFDAANAVLQDIPFEPSHTKPRGPIKYTGPFFVPVPLNPAIRRAAVLRNGVELASRSASANPPTVQIVSPNGGENLTSDPVSFTWTASDPDGDALTFDVQYSRDGGATWITIGTDLVAQTYPVPRSILPGSTTALFRVSATDGFLTATDQSDGRFTVSNRAPFLFLRTPSVNQLFVGQQQVVFGADARDVEDGAIASFQWSSNVNGALGAGKTLLKLANQLSPGTHTITVTGTDSQGGIGSASVVIRIGATLPPAYADLSLELSAGPDPVHAGNTLIYVLTVLNTGADTATSVTLSHTLPAGVAFVSANSSQGSCGQASGIVTCTLGSIAEDALATVTVVVTPPGFMTLESSASVTSAQEDPLPANNSAVLSTTMSLLSTDGDISISKTDSPDPVAPSGTVTYTLSVSNLGSQGVTNVTVTDTLPSEVTYQSASGSSWSCGHSSGTVTCTRPGLASGAAPPITIVVTAPATPGSVTNTATVSAAEADSVMSNNSASATTSVGGDPGASAFHTVTPCRVADTRDPAGPYGAPPLTAGAARTFTVGGRCGIPVNARAVAFNVTVTGSNSGGHIALYPGGNPLPLVSTINFAAGQTRANNAIVPLGSGGTLTVFPGMNAGATADFIIDVNGYFE